MKKISQLFGIKSQLCIALVAILGFGFSACNDNLEDVNPTSDELVPMKLSVGMAGAKASTYASKYEFNMGDQIGIFIFENEFPAYNLRATLNQYQWDLEEPVFLNDRQIRLNAYYPYNPMLSQMEDENYIPIEHVSQTDYMYGGTHYPISRNNPYAIVDMKHALSLVQFCFKRADYPFEGKIREIEIFNTGTDIGLYSSGYMSLIDERVVSQSDQSQPATIRENQMPLPFISDSDQSEMLYPRIMVMPMAPLSHGGQVSIRFYIDNNIYTYPLPEKTTWQSGHKYTYNVTVHANRLTVGIAMIQDWIEGNQPEEISPN